VNQIIIGLHCQSIKKKYSAWELLSPDIVVACETWLDQSKIIKIISTSYKLYRHDRSDRYGGVFIAVNSAISCHPVSKTVLTY